MTKHIVGFLEFVREQGVVGLAVGFILGGAVSKVVTSLVSDIINPVVGVLLGSGEVLAAASTSIGAVKIRWGSFLAVLIDFLIVACVVYFGVKLLGIERLDKKKK